MVSTFCLGLMVSVFVGQNDNYFTLINVIRKWETAV